MTRFADQLFDDLMREHGPALARTTVSAAPRRRRTNRPLMLAAAAGGLAVAAAAGALAAGGGTPAYAVTAHSNGTVTVAVYQKSGVAGANARLRQLGDDQVVVVPVGAGCPSMNSLPAPAVSGVGQMISEAGSVSADGSVTVTAQGIPAGDILVVVVQTANGGTFSASTLTSPPVPSCVSPPAQPSPPPASSRTATHGSRGAAAAHNS